MYLNITEGSPLLEFDEDDTIGLNVYSGSWNVHYSNGELNTYIHYYQAQFGAKLPGEEVSTFINSTGPVEEAFPLSDPEIEQCSRESSPFIKVPVEVYLQSPYIYHLGVVFSWIEIYVTNNTQDYSQTHSFGSHLSIVTDACKNLLVQYTS